MTKRLRLGFLGPLFGLLFGLGAVGAAAQTGAAVVRPDPATLTIVAGQTQTIAVVVAGVADLYGIDVRASFDPALIEIVDDDLARDGVQMTPGVLPQPDFVALNAADNAAGTLRYAATQVNPTPPAAGDGIVFTLQVRGKAAGVSPLRIDLVEMANRSGELLSVTTQDGAITVSASGAAATGIALTPLPGDAPGAAATTTGLTPTATLSALPATANAATPAGVTVVAPATAPADANASTSPVAVGAVTDSASTAAPEVMSTPAASAAATGATPDAVPLAGGSQPPGDGPATAAPARTVAASVTASTAAAGATDQGAPPPLAVVGANGDAPAALVSAPAAPAAVRSALLLVAVALIVFVIGVLLWRRARSR